MTAGPIIVTDTDDLQRKFRDHIFDSMLGITLVYADRLAVELVEVLRADCPTPATEAKREPCEGEPCRLPYTYFVSYSARGGFGCNEIGTSAPLDRFADVMQLKETIATSPNPHRLRPDEIAILNFILLSGPKEA